MPVSELTPYYVYMLIEKETGELIEGGGSSTSPRPRIYPSIESAKRGRKGLRYPEGAIEIVEYRMTGVLMEGGE